MMIFIEGTEACRTFCKVLENSGIFRTFEKFQKFMEFSTLS